MNQKRVINLFFILTLFSTVTLLAQTVSGVVKGEKGEPMPQVSVVVKGTSNGVATDFDGKYNVEASKGDILIFSFVGYKTIEKKVTGSVLDVTMTSGVSLDEIVLVGNKAKPRTILTSTVPIDNISAKDLKVSAQPEVDKMIAYRVPSFNSTNQTISDATAHFDPSELRNLGPSRTLVLVNGKRKNQSALVYVNETPGRGEVGVDMKSIPASSIKRVEVLRDGASAQYGSDAIAGVINIILKEKSDQTTINLGTGITTEGDGLTYNADINGGVNFNDKGFLNVTADYYHQDYTNRAGTPGNDQLFGNVFQPSKEKLDNGEITQAEYDEQKAFADSLLDGSHPWIQENPDLGMTVGQPAYDKVGLAINSGVDYANNMAEAYLSATLQVRNGKSFALYRAPYWVDNDFGLLTKKGATYNGFQPTFETAIIDNLTTIGTKFKTNNEWNFDVSYTHGQNVVNYTIGNSINLDLGKNSPTEFNPGGYRFYNNIGNLDIAKTFGMVSLSLGSEVRAENFITKAGEPASYYEGGAQSFPGLRPENAVNADRSNVGVYAGLDFDITESLLISSAARYENYSDFGDNVSWKVSGRVLLPKEKGAIRASVNTGFRAPSLHQIYLSNIQTLQLDDGTIGQQGTFNNVDPIIVDKNKGLGVPELNAEESFNFSGGLTYKITPKVSVSLDYYNIAVDNRVLLTNPLGFDNNDANTNAVEQVLIDNKVKNITFFVNAVDTKTQGVDFVTSINNLALGKGDLGINLAFNWNETELDGKIAVPTKIEEAGYTDIFNREEQSRITTARPNMKGVFGLTYELPKFSVNLNNTYFGEVTWRHSTKPENDQTFAGKVITDLSMSYDLSKSVSASLSANNLLNVYPDEIETNGDFGTDLGGRFKYPWEVNQFGFNGTVINAGLTFKL